METINKTEKASTEPAVVSSFSSRVKAELVFYPAEPEEEIMLTELSAMLSSACRLGFYPPFMRVKTENRHMLQKSFMSFQRLFDITPEVRGFYGLNGLKTRYYEAFLFDEDEIRMVIDALGFWREHEGVGHFEMDVPESFTETTEQKRAFLRGIFLADGSVTDPEKQYHLEFVQDKRERAERICRVLKDFDIRASIIERQRAGQMGSNFVVYLKDADRIVELLNVMGAHKALMQFENVRILKGLRNNVNRQVNCETANINKTASTSYRQIEDIDLLVTSGRFELLDESLKQIAMLRQENPEMPLKQLGTLLNPPLGKSGVFHRLAKLSEMAEEERKGGIIKVNKGE